MNILAAIFRNAICKFLSPIPIRRIYNFISVKSKVIDDLLVECSSTWIKQSEQVMEISLAMCHFIYFNNIRFELFPFYKYFTKKYEMWGFYFQNLSEDFPALLTEKTHKYPFCMALVSTLHILPFFFPMERKDMMESFVLQSPNQFFIYNKPTQKHTQGFYPPWKKQPTG